MVHGSGGSGRVPKFGPACNSASEYFYSPQNASLVQASLTTSVWLVGSRRTLSSLDITRPVLQLGGNIVAASDHVRLLDVDIVSDLGLDRHVTNVSASCFYRLRQMRRIRRSLDNQSVTTLVHALVSMRIDYCNSVLAAAPKTTTESDKLQRVLNAAARVASNTCKFDRGLSQLLHDELHRLDVPDHVAFKLIVTVHRCLNGRAPNYLSNHVIPVSAIVSRQRLRSAQQNTLHGGPTLQIDHIRPSSIFCCRSHSVEQSSCYIQGPDNQRCLLSTAFKDSSVYTTASAP